MTVFLRWLTGICCCLRLPLFVNSEFALIASFKTSLSDQWWWSVIVISDNEGALCLIHWGRVTHICINKLTIIGSDNDLSPDRRQAIVWTNAGIIEPLRTIFSEIWMEVHTFSFKKMHLKMSSEKWRPCCLGLNVLKPISLTGFHGNPSIFDRLPYRSLITRELLHVPFCLGWMRGIWCTALYNQRKISKKY